MASKGPRSKLDHDTRTRRQKALEAPKEPPRPKTHWDHVLEEMVWLSKDFESERKWKLAQAKKVSIRASKSVLDFATWGEKKVKEEEHRLKKVAFNISKDVKKFWTKIEKLVFYKYQLELEERKKKALDKQLNFLLGQTERYSTMLAENLVDVHSSAKSVAVVVRTEEDLKKKEKQGDTTATEVENFESDDDYSIQSDDDLEDDEHTIDEDEAQITEAERRDELAALQAEADLSLEELLKSYGINGNVRESDSESNKDSTELIMIKHQIKDCSNQVNGSVQDYKTLSNIDALPATNEEHCSVENNHLHHDSHQLHHGESNGDSCLEKPTVKILEKEVFLEGLKPSGDGDSTHDPGNETDDGDYRIIDEEEQDDETTLVEEEELTKEDATDPLNEILLLQQESEMPREELLARYTKGSCSADDMYESRCASSDSDEQLKSAIEHNGDQDNKSFAVTDDLFKVEKPTEHTEPDSAFKEVKVSNDHAIDGRESEDIIADAAAAARSAQPTGNTFSTTKVRTKFPFLIKHPLREYQHIGLDWLVTMYEKRLNGILADEMGLGKTIMTIALLAHLACEKGIWGPHLIVVPTSVMLNWETEFLKWCPAFKILTYFGTAKERKHKRQGWLKPNYFHVCITTYRLVIQDSKIFKRKKWKYLILDEAHLIKNWKSQRWQTLLNFNSKRRILLTGTPLQNDLMELWSLMHFLMPHIFQSHQEFKDWFCNPISGMVEGQEKVNKEVVDRLHNVLRPFILRRMKRDVEKQLPQKHEHVINCRLSKRQRNLYEDFIASSETQATLASANFFGMISVIMQLRKVCNHPDLFEGRPIVSSFDMAGIDMQLSSLVCSVVSSDPFSKVDLSGLNFLFTQNEFEMSSWEFDEVMAISNPPKFVQETVVNGTDVLHFCSNKSEQKRRTHGINIFEEIQKSLWDERVKHLKERTASISWWNSLQCQNKPVYGTNLRELVTIKHPVFHIHEQKNSPSCYMNFSSRLTDIVLSPIERFHKMLDIIESFMFAIPASRAPVPICWCSKGRSPVFVDLAYKEECTRALSPLLSPIRPAIVRRQVYFPDRRLIQFDCGKLQELAVLLRCLKSEGHRALIFTQMTKMLDILEAFINLYGYTYLRLDGSTQPEERQTLMQRFNTNPKYFLFILSTRSGGVGINLVGADTVIFYDSDWNPAMDQQAQDRCHRIGQTREVHIYRLISESTIEENILKKANQKRALDDLVIQSGSYNTEFFKKLDPMELFSGHETLKLDNIQKNNNAAECSTDGTETLMTNVDVEAAIKHAEDEVDYMALKRVEQEEEVDNQEFAEDGIGRPDDDELGNEDDMKHDERIVDDQRFQVAVQSKENVGSLQENHVIQENAIIIAGGDEDIDMLADVKQMAAAAAAAGQASSSFENQLRPIDRYAMRFLELWDPIVDKSAIEHQVDVEEQEWELDRIEKFKEDLEAEIDEDQEPFLYEKWDADFATTAYQQHVEALTQRQLLEELECEDLAANEAEENGTSKKQATGERKPKKKNKSKTKFKSLKKGPPASDAQAGETRDDPMFIDDDVFTPEYMSHESPPLSPPTQKKRKRGMNVMEEDEANSRKVLKKIKKGSDNKNVECSDLSLKQHSETGETKIGEGTNDLELKLPYRSKVAAKVSITYVPMKRTMLVKPEKLRKKGPPWAKDWLPPSDSWSSQEDAILCAVVHEYGTHWSLVSDSLYSMPCGGLYKGRFRHPIHCSERFRELFSKYVLSAMESSHSEKMNPGLGKTLLKVTEDQVRVLLNVTSELPNNELLLQKHFVAVLSSVWRAKCQLERCQTLPSSRNSLYSSRITSDHSTNKSQRLTEGMSSANFRNCSRLVQSAIDDDREQRDMPVKPSSHLESPASVDRLDLTLEFSMEQEESGKSFPYSFCVSIRGPEPVQQFSESPMQHLRQKTTRRIAENRFRMASEACIENEGSGWAQSAFLSVANNRYKSSSRSQTLGKHKSACDSSTRPSKSKLQRTTEPQEDTYSFTKSVLPSRRPTTFEFITPAEVLDLDYDHAFDSYSQDSHDIEFIPHNYDPNFCTELDDIGSLMDFTDIG